MNYTELYLTFKILTGARRQTHLIDIFQGIEVISFYKGEALYPKSRQVHDENGISVRINSVGPASLDDLLSIFLSSIKDTNLLKKAVEQFKSELCAVLYAVDRSAELWISHKNLSELSDLGLDFGIDYYILPSEG